MTTSNQAFGGTEAHTLGVASMIEETHWVGLEDGVLDLGSLVMTEGLDHFAKRVPCLALAAGADAGPTTMLVAHLIVATPFGLAHGWGGLSGYHGVRRYHTHAPFARK